MPRKHIIIGFVALLVVLAGVLAYSSIVFRVTSTSPKGDEHPSFVKYVDFYFSHPVKSVDKVILNGTEASGTVDIKGKWVRYTHPETYANDVESTLILESVTSTNNRTITVEHKFTPAYTDFKDIPKDIRQESVEKSSSGQEDDPFFNNYFPMIVDKQVEIEAIENPSTHEMDLYVTFFAEYHDYDLNREVTVSNAEADQLREKTLEYIRSLGGTPEKYDIHYKNRYLEDKYNPHDDWQ